uniref:Uncharacterized protein n=1 Tax=Peronospora matthiolae TaxID=2874970 RepID=A0AAV1TMQ8_9STRA
MSSQRVHEEDERMIGAVESGMFASKLGANMRGRLMTIDALLEMRQNNRQRRTRTSAQRNSVSRASPNLSRRIARLRTQLHRRLNRSFRRRSTSAKASMATGFSVHRSVSSTSGSMTGVSFTKGSEAVSLTGDAPSCA